jgi:hypothetical protein
MVSHNIVAESSQDQAKRGKTVKAFTRSLAGNVGIDPRREGYQVEWLKITPSMFFCMLLIDKAGLMLSRRIKSCRLPSYRPLHL